MEIDSEWASKTGISSYGTNLIIMVQNSGGSTPEFQEKLKLCRNDYDVFHLVFGDQNEN